MIASFRKVVPPTLIIALIISFSPSVLPAHASPGDETTYYFLSDHLGSVDVVLDEDGNVVERRDYLPYGQERYVHEEQNAPATAQGFTGKELDDETGLNYYGGRYYDATIGRFISSDPWEGNLNNPQTLNKYSYSANNPLRFIDPTGQKVEEFQPYSSGQSSYVKGDFLGEYRGIQVRSPGSNLTGSGQHNYQCVTLVKNFARQEFGVELSGTGNGVDYGNENRINSALRANSPEAMGSFSVHTNGGYFMPQEDDIISWTGGDYGHVGFIAEVIFDDQTGVGEVYTIEQNADSEQALFVQSLTRGYDENGNAVYNVSDRMSGYHVQSWANYTNQSTTADLFQPEYTNTLHSPASKPVEEQPDS